MRESETGRLQPTYCDLLQQGLQECVVRRKILKDLGVMADVDQYRKSVLGYGLMAAMSQMSNIDGLLPDAR